ncbi:MAG: WD40 repeat domain-containing protein [Crinalium sp.]
MYKHLHTLEKHPEYLICFTISPDGKALISSCYDIIKVWDLEEGTLICSHELNKGRTPLHFSLVVNSDWTTFITNFDSQIRIYDLLEGSLISNFSTGTSGSLAIHPDGKTIIVGHYKMSRGESFAPIELFDLQSKKLVQTLQGHEHTVSSVIISPDGKRLVSQSYHLSVKVWDLLTGKELCSFYKPPRRWIDTVAFVNLTELIVSGCRFSGNENRGNDWKDLHTEVWNILTDEVIYTFPKSPRRDSPHPPGEPRSVMMPDGKILVTGSDRDIVVWDLQQGKKLCTLQGHNSKVENLAIAPNGQTIASYAEDGICIWKRQ